MRWKASRMPMRTASNGGLAATFTPRKPGQSKKAYESKKRLHSPSLIAIVAAVADENPQVVCNNPFRPIGRVVQDLRHAAVVYNKCGRTAAVHGDGIDRAQLEVQHGQFFQRQRVPRL